MTAAIAPATTSPTAIAARAIAAFTRTAVTRVNAMARAGGATVLGAAGLASIAVGAGAEWGWPVGLMVGGPLAVWFASLLPDPGEPT